MSDEYRQPVDLDHAARVREILAAPLKPPTAPNRATPRPAPSVCSSCGAPAIRDVFARSYCGSHLAALFRRFDPSTFAPYGLMLPTGPIGADGCALTTCAACEATATGPVFSPCPWCCRRYERELVWQAELTLTPPDIDSDDRTHDSAMKAWAERLARSVLAGVVTRAQAERALTRSGHRAA